jgi:hypothetical protein
VVPTIDTFRASTFQIPGAAYPFAVGGSTPKIGAPLGRDLITGDHVFGDPISHYHRANLISVPTAAVLGKVGLGKSSLVRHILLCQRGMGKNHQGALPLIFGDLKGEYIDMVRALDGQVISLGPGAGYLNILNPGEARQAAQRLVRAEEEAAAAGDHERAETLREIRQQVLEDAHTRRLVGVTGLITIAREGKPQEREESILDAALRVLDERWRDRPEDYVIKDLLDIVREGPPEVRTVAVDHNNIDYYKQLIEGLEVSLQAMISGGRLGTMFAQQTTEPMRHDCAVVFDVARLRAAGSQDMKAAGLFTGWVYGMGAVNVAHALAAAGLEKRWNYSAVFDELWETLRVGHGMPGRIDALLRTNRSVEGMAVTLVTHSLTDAEALDGADREMARSLIEKAGMVFLGGLPRKEMAPLRLILGVSQAEEEMVVGWTDPGAWDPETGAEAAPPGQGCFLMKYGGGDRPGTPFHLDLTSVELNLHRTSQLWEDVRPKAPRQEPPTDPELELVLEPEPEPIEELPPVPVAAATREAYRVPDDDGLAPVGRSRALEVLMAAGPQMDPNDRAILTAHLRSADQDGDEP